MQGIEKIDFVLIKLWDLIRKGYNYSPHAIIKSNFSCNDTKHYEKNNYCVNFVFKRPIL